MVEDFLNVHYFYVTVEGRVVDSNINGFFSFSGNLLVILVYYFEVGDFGFGW